jgi:hypothetical protein
MILCQTSCQDSYSDSSFTCRSMSFDRIKESGDTVYNPIEKEVIVESNYFIHNYWSVTPVINKKNRIIRSDTFIVEDNTIILNVGGKKFNYFNKKSFKNKEIMVIPELREGGDSHYDCSFYFLKPDSILGSLGTNIYRYNVLFKSTVANSIDEALIQPTIDGALEYGVFEIHPILGVVSETVSYGWSYNRKYNFGSEISQCADSLVLKLLK